MADNVVSHVCVFEIGFNFNRPDEKSLVVFFRSQVVARLNTVVATMVCFTSQTLQYQVETSSSYKHYQTYW